MRQVFLNACIYAKQKINLTWPYLGFFWKISQFKMVKKGIRASWAKLIKLANNN